MYFADIHGFKLTSSYVEVGGVAYIAEAILRMYQGMSANKKHLKIMEN